MTWVRYDDNVANHPKVAPLDDAPYRLWREAIEWSSHNLTDGIIRTRQLTLTSVRATKARAGLLVQVGLWHVRGTPCDSPKCPPSGEDGWVIHDYWDYQRTAEQVRADQEANRARQRKWMEQARAGKRGKANGHTNGDTNGVSNASDNSNPAPPRPAPKGGGDFVPQRSPAADGDGVAADGGAEDQNSHDSILCPTCGNAMSSTYHRRVCRSAA